MKLRYKRLWLGLGLLVLLTPLGILLPEKFGANGAWGEWSARQLKEKWGYVPAQLEKLEGLWKALFPEYSIPGMTKPWQTKMAYLLAGLLGAGVVLILCLGLGRWLAIPEGQRKRNAS